MGSSCLLFFAWEYNEETVELKQELLRNGLVSPSAERRNSASGGVEAHATLVHHARHTASDFQFLPTCGANDAMLLLCLGLAAWKMKVCLD